MSYHVLISENSKQSTLWILEHDCSRNKVCFYVKEIANSQMRFASYMRPTIKVHEISLETFLVPC